MGEAAIGKKLLSSGWKQGILFSLSGLEVPYYDVSSSSSPEIKYYQPAVDDRFIIISQDCDILSDKEPYVEVLLCIQLEISNKIPLNSARKFRLAEDLEFVALSTYRLLISKEYLNTLPPHSGQYLFDDTRFGLFTRWLAKRYARPAFPDDLVEKVIRPLKKSFEKLFKFHKLGFDAFNNNIKELRIKVFSDGTIYSVSFTFLAKSAELDVQSLEFFDLLKSSILATCNLNGIKLEEETSLTTPYEYTLQDYFDSYAVDFDDYSSNSDKDAQPPSIF